MSLFNRSPSFFRLVLSLVGGLVLGGPAWSRPPALCNQPFTALSRIQGKAPHSPLRGRHETVEATVVAAVPGLGGFFIESPRSRWDEDPATPEGLFVYAPHWRVRTGERLRIRGLVKEYWGQTELSGERLVARCGRARLPAAQSISVRDAFGGRLRRYAGMRITVGPGAVLADSHDLKRFGSVELSPQRQIQPTQILSPGRSANALANREERRRLWLDDGSARRFPKSGPWQPLLTRKNGLRLGDALVRAEGVVDYRFHHWRVELTRPPRFDDANPRAPAPARPQGDLLRLVSFNLENYFNGNGRGGGFPTARGARTEKRFRHQRARLTRAIRALNPDVLAVMELENDGYGRDSAIAGLARALGPHWRFVNPGRTRLGTDAIAVGLLYRADRVRAIGAPLIPDARVLDRGNRLPLGQVFVARHGGPKVLVVANHFKSRRCEHARGRERDQGDGQGCWNPLRAAAASALVRWLDRLGDRLPQRRLVVGDLNAYAREQPITLLEKSGLVDLVSRFIGPRAYSFSYRGRIGYLDHALASPALASHVIAVTEWHIDADEPPVQDSRNDLGPWRASDHDPLIVDLGPGSAALFRR